MKTLFAQVRHVVFAHLIVFRYKQSACQSVYKNRLMFVIVLVVMINIFGFGKKKDRELEEVISQIKVDLSNNYKDNAVENIKKLRELIDLRSMDGAMKKEELEEYRQLLEGFEMDVRNFKRTY